LYVKSVKQAGMIQYCRLAWKITTSFVVHKYLEISPAILLLNKITHHNHNSETVSR